MTGLACIIHDSFQLNPVEPVASKITLATEVAAVQSKPADAGY